MRYNQDREHQNKYFGRLSSAQAPRSLSKYTIDNTNRFSNSSLIFKKYQGLSLDCQIMSSLDCSIWHSFCSFFCSQLYQLELAFFFITTQLFLKVPVEKETELSRGGAIPFLTFPQRNVCVGDDCTMCQRQNALRVLKEWISSLIYFFYS